MMMTKKLKDNKIVLWLVLIGVIYVMKLMGIPMFARNVLLVVISSLYLYWTWKDCSIIKWEVLILLLGLIARIAFCYLDVYTDFNMPIGGGNDGVTFLKTAIDYCNGDFSVFYTRYPYVLYAIFQITGIDQFAAQYVNIICWGLAMIILQESCRRLEITGLLRILALVVMSWLPTSIWITSILYRDTMVMLLLFLSFYFLLSWMQEKKLLNIIFSILSTITATLLHGGSIVALVPIIITLIFYSNSEKKYLLTKNNIIVTGTIIILCCVVLAFPNVQGLILNKFSFLRNGLVEGINSWLAMKYDYSEGAGSNYLVNRYLNGYLDIIVMMIQRIYYQMLSPAPNIWRGLTDVIAFWGSTAPIYLIALIAWFVSLFYKKKDAFRFVMLIEVVVTIVIYAWANVNAGAALRHREKIIGLVILLATYSLNIIIQERKERKESESISKK